MPVSVGEWRVRIGRFIHWVRENVIIERKEKLLKERIRRLKLLQKRLLEKKEKSEDECKSKPNDLSVKVDDAPNESNIVNNNTTNDSHKEDSSTSESTIEGKATQKESTTYHKSNGTDSTFPFFFTLFLSMFSLLLSLIFFFVFDFSNLLESYKPFLKRIGESSWRSTCLVIFIVCSNLAYIVLSYVIKNNEDLQDNLVLVGDENSKAESTTEVNNTTAATTIRSNNSPTELNIKENNTRSESTIKENSTPTKSTTKVNNTRTKSTSTTENNKTLTESRFKEKNTTIESTGTKKCNNIPRNATIKEKDKLTRRENSTLPGSTIKDNIAPKECHINTPSVAESTIKESSPPSNIKDKISKRKTTKYKNTATRSEIRGKTITSTTESTIKDNSSTESTIKDNSSTESTIKDNPLTESTIKDNSSTESTIKDNSSTESTIKENSLTESTIKDNSSTESTIKDNSSTESPIKEDNTKSESPIKGDNSTSESAIKGNNSTSESAIEGNNSTSESAIKGNNSTSESAIKGNNSTSESAIKGINSTSESTIKGNYSTSKSAIKGNNSTSESAIKGNNSTSESAVKDSNATTESAIKENNTPSRTPTEENNNQPMKLNIAQAECTIPSKIQKVLSEGKHSISSQIPSSLKGTTDEPVMQESTCIPEMILVKAGDVELNPGPFDRSANIQEQELLNLAYDVPSSKYTELCIRLGVSYNQSQTILDIHHLDFTRSLNAVFFQWKDRQRDGTDCRQVIAAALRGVNLNALGDKMSRGGYLPQEAAPTASIANEKVPLTPEQVTRCADDFKTFYRTQLCKIKTDPLDFSLVLEFERIYTDLVLLRNEQGTTKKIPLDYKEVLKTEVNGELPKRLMVEGEGGAGKTTFCSKMAWDWTNGVDEFREFDWVLVIPLRDIERNQTVGDIARTYLLDNNSVQPHQIDEYILANPSKVFIIFDGLDEYDGDLVKEENDIAKIIRSEKFKECRVLVTTRPWKADQIKSNAKFMRTYAFIAVAGFDKKHISIYINKYFADDSQASQDLIKFIEDNDVIRENMAPFPIYIAMLCILWRVSDSKKRELIRRLKTFSQLFQEIITMLKEHYVSKHFKDLDTETFTQFYEQLGVSFTEIGKIALSGVMDKKLVYAINDFSSCEEAMETCCKVGVLSKEKRLVPKHDRHKNMTSPVIVNVFFPHKLFQEYLAGMYLASLFESDFEQYEKARNDVIPRAEEFRYLLYFTASQAKKVASDITNKLMDMDMDMDMEHNILVDITFEGYDEDSAKVVGQHLFEEQKSLEIDDIMSAHTVSGYFFIMDKITMVKFQYFLKKYHK